MNHDHHHLTSPSFLQKLSLDLIRSRKSNYLEDCINYHLHDSKFILQDIPDLFNHYDHLLKCTFIKHKVSLLEKVQLDFVNNNNQSRKNQSEKCIVYLHGLGSNRIEAFSLLSHLPKNYSLFTFDFSGSGKSQGQFTTYGYRQKDDIQSILIYLYKHKHIRQFVIWGRSMGAVASLLFNNLMVERQIENSQQKSQRYNTMATVFKCVKCIVADSPFSSFEEISKDIAFKKMSIPTFFTQIALKFLQNSFEKLLFDEKSNKCFTPFQINFTKNILKPIVPMIFVYSLNDQIVNCDHSEKIINAVEKSRAKLIEKIIIPDCGHNLKRPDNVFQVIFQKIKKHCMAKSTQLELDSHKHKKSLQIFENQSEIQKNTKGIRNKSFWNFEQQFSENFSPKKKETIIVPPQQSPEAQNKNKFSSARQTKEQTRRNIFDRDSKVQQSKMNTSVTKKRGISLSSTIERGDNLPKQSNRNIQNVVYKARGTKDIKSSQQVHLARPMSLQYKTLNNIPNDEQSRENSPKKGIGIARGNSQIMSQNFSKSIKNRPSLGGHKPRISLGGSVQKRSKPTIEFTKTSNYGKIFSKQNYYSQMAPERDSSNTNSFSTISYSDQAMYNSVGKNKNFQTITLNKQSKLQKKIIQEHFDSEPNIIMDEDFDLRRISSRQSINTIDEGQLGKQIDESLSNFINTKLQFGLDEFSNNSGSGFSKFKTIQPSSNGGNKCKQSLILSQIDIKQVKQLAQASNKLSTITMPSHISLRPSSRLYHQKRKKKLQAHSILINKQNQNVKITNDRYLKDDE